MDVKRPERASLQGAWDVGHERHLNTRLDGPQSSLRGIEAGSMKDERPNVIFVFGDQWRAQATGYAGDPNVHTPNLDALARESLVFKNAVSGCPVCSPARASIMTGRYPLTHGVFLNDVYLKPRSPSIAHVYREAGYDTAYIGKWHLDGHGRSSFIPPERRQGFRYWRAMECTHDYNNSYYYADEPVKLRWEGYDAFAQTREAIRYMRHARRRGPFLLFLSWGPPHSPYDTAPKEYQELYDPDDIVLRPNVPEACQDQARRDLAGYYAHISALDACVGELVEALEDLGIVDDTLLVFTSDHGDMHGSQGQWRKQSPWDESILIPLVMRYPAVLRRGETDLPINTPDLVPTILGLTGLEVPSTVEGRDYSAHLVEGRETGDIAALIACYTPFAEWWRDRGGREYRGVRTQRYTYVRSLDGPWLLYDNISDPYQMNNLSQDPSYAEVAQLLDDELSRLLRQTKDRFEPAQTLLDRYGLVTDERGAVPYTP